MRGGGRPGWPRPYLRALGANASRSLRAETRGPTCPGRGHADGLEGLEQLRAAVPLLVGPHPLQPRAASAHGQQITRPRVSFQVPKVGFGMSFLCKGSSLWTHGLYNLMPRTNDQLHNGRSFSDPISITRFIPHCHCQYTCAFLHGLMASVAIGNGRLATERRKFLSVWFNKRESCHRA